MYPSRNALIYKIDEMSVTHHAEMEKMKMMLEKEKEKVKQLEDKFGVTKKREWDTRHRSWWMMWLFNSDTDAYEYLMKVVHKTLLKKDGMSMKKMMRVQKRELKRVSWGEKKDDDIVNIYGMRLKSREPWLKSRIGDNRNTPIYLEQVSLNLRNFTKGVRRTEGTTIKDLQECCRENKIEFKKTWKKNVLIGAILKHKDNEEEDEGDITIEVLKEMIKEKEGCDIM